jgi:class 3 adenylate cyclase
MLARALMADGDPEGAALELETARSALERLGAGPDAQRAGELMASLRRPTVVRRTFVFTDIVGSTALIEAIGDEAWSDLGRWHDETLRACATRHNGDEVDHAGDGFFFAFPSVDHAIAFAQEAQRSLAEHRREHGFAPQVRIGLHAADATSVGGQYLGKGVHAAARIGAEAGGGEIVASAASVEAIDGLRLSDRRSVPLKGLAEPVEIVAIDWR